MVYPFAYMFHMLDNIVHINYSFVTGYGYNQYYIDVSRMLI